MKEKTRNAVTGYTFLLPFLTFFAAFFLLPTCYSLWLSFYKYRGYGNPRFVGWGNFQKLLYYDKFWMAVGNTFFYLFAHWIPAILLSFILALAIHECSKLVQRIYKPIIFLPQIVATVASALVFRVIFATNSGVFSQLLGKQIPFLSDPGLMKWTVVILMTWRATGWFFVIFLSGLTIVSKDVIEAATIDGASYFQRLFYIVIPLMRKIFMFTFLMETMSTLKVFVEPNMLISGGMTAPPAAKPIVSILVDNVNNGYFGLASASGWILFVFIFILTMIQYYLFNRPELKEKRKQGAAL